jgi:hypothetical protein
VTISWNSANAIERSDASIRGSTTVVGQQGRRGERKVGEDHGVLREAPVAKRLFPLARQHEHRLRAHRFGRLQITQAVADARHAGHRDIEADADLLQHARLRLAALAPRVGRVRAEEHGVDAPARLCERAVHLVVNRVERREIEQAPTDAGLVRRDDDAIAGVIEPRDRFEAAWNRPPFVR